jgi:Zn-finger nucleic acid-binding protein
MWLDADELERIEELSVNDYQEEIRQLPNLVDQAYAMALARSKPEVKCPQCGAEMERREHAGCSQVLIDACPKCRGVWLDEGELQALEVFFERTQSETREVRVGFFGRLMRLFD